LPEDALKALTIRQPWAWAIIHAGKDIENRSWNSRLRGTTAIHAGFAYDKHVELPRGGKPPHEEALVRCAIIGVADIVDVVEGQPVEMVQWAFRFCASQSPRAAATNILPWKVVVVGSASQAPEGDRKAINMNRAIHSLLRNTKIFEKL
jgi:hypothetical protein